MKSQMSLKMGNVRSKVGQILEKPCVSNRGLIFSLMLMKLGQNICLPKHFWTSLKIGHVRHFLALFMSSWISPVLGWGSKVSCPRILPQKTQRIQCGSNPGPLEYEQGPKNFRILTHPPAVLHSSYS